ncbi:MAG: hypothetical protein ACYDBX_02295 [Patescibacteria group bacterium]
MEGVERVEQGISREEFRERLSMLSDTSLYPVFKRSDIFYAASFDFTVDDERCEHVEVRRIIGAPHLGTEKFRNWGDIQNRESRFGESRSEGVGSRRLGPRWEEYMHELTKQVERSGIESVSIFSGPIYLDEFQGIYYVDLDGTRRVVVAKLLGIDKVPALVTRIITKHGVDPWKFSKAGRRIKKLF